LILNDLRLFSIWFIYCQPPRENWMLCLLKANILVAGLKTIIINE